MTTPESNTHTEQPPARGVAAVLRKRRVLVVLVLAVVGSFAFQGCQSSVPRRDPSGERFPEARARSLEGEVLTLPDAFLGQPTVVLVGYVMDAQFDLDRWILGLLQAETPARIFEVPTIRGAIPGLFAGKIDAGMQSGIPVEDWASVVTVYGGAADGIVRFTGNESPRNGRVLLLDADGQVLWFHDRGYSASKLLELDAAVRAQQAD